MKYTRSGGQSAVGPEAWFTGTVHIDGIRNPDEQSAVGCAHVRFSPSARTAGATADRFMAQIAVQEANGHGQIVTWGEHVTDQDYGQPAATSN
ncbi:hypothetical protein IWX75_000002 [Arthrobacter sp. CAN_A6]|uniref:hypothetical protein n=1 Tax=Arthrobacter sp. CAN_A6 TaxID=2787721 RepID=UPI0018CBA812